MHKIDPALKKAAIGYIINKKYWNQGLTTEANRAVIELAFEKIGMNKLTALHDKDNPRIWQGHGEIRHALFP